MAPVADHIVYSREKLLAELFERLLAKAFVNSPVSGAVLFPALRIILIIGRGAFARNFAGLSLSLSPQPPSIYLSGLYTRPDFSNTST